MSTASLDRAKFGGVKIRPLDVRRPKADDARAEYVTGMKKWKADQEAVLHSSWKNKWKEARKEEVEAYYAQTKNMTGAQLLDLKGEAAKDIKRPNSKRTRKR